jgi:ankyrin repeat protein
MTALHYAVYENNAEAVRGLAAAGADIDAVDENPWVRLTPIMMGCQNSAIDAIRALVDLGCRRAFSLPQVVGTGDARTVSFVLQLPEQADLTVKEVERDTPELAEVHRWSPESMATWADFKACHWVAYTGNTEAARVLIEAGHDFRTCVRSIDETKSKCEGMNSEDIARAHGHDALAGMLACSRAPAMARDGVSGSKE